MSTWVSKYIIKYNLILHTFVLHFYYTFSYISNLHIFIHLLFVVVHFMKSDIICVQHSDTQQSKREREKQKTTTTTTTEQKSNNNNIKNITSTVETAKNYM